MNIGLISDLHTDASGANKTIVSYIIDAIKKAKLDVFVLAGDITPKLSEFYEILGEFAKADLACQKLFVPGNHDVWVNKTANMTSEQKCRIISEVCEDHGFHSLIDAPYIIEKIAFCGTIGWYDYTFASDSYDFSTKQYTKKQLMGRVWSDKHYVNWMDSDENIAHRFENDLKQQIDSVRDKVQRIIVVTHHVPFQECIRYRGELPWDFFRAYMGSKGLGEICLQEPLVSHVLFGHVHQVVNQRVKDVQAICAPIGYLDERKDDELQKYAEQRLTCFSVTTEPSTVENI